MVMTGSLAVLAGPWDITDFAFREGAVVADLIDPHPEILSQSAIDIVLPK